MKSAEQWANEIQSAFGDGMSVSAQRRLLEQSVRAAQADALRHAAQVCKRSADNLVASEKLNPDGVLLLIAVRIEQVANELEEAR